MEQALARLQPGHDSILGIFDVAGFSWANADFQFVDFLVSSATLNDKQGQCFSQLPPIIHHLSMIVACVHLLF